MREGNRGRGFLAQGSEDRAQVQGGRPLPLVGKNRTPALRRHADYALKWFPPHEGPNGDPGPWGVDGYQSRRFAD